MSATAIPVAIFGTEGRMARAIREAAAVEKRFRLVAAVPARGRSPAQIAAALDDTPADTVVLDFTHRAALLTLLDSFREAPRALVTGTSGLEAGEEAALKGHSNVCAVMRGRNFSLGAVIAARLISALSAAAARGGAWDAAVIDFHHNRKLDAPSATGKAWAAAWADGSGAADPPISSIRLGNGISEHTLIAAGCGERVEIAHRLLSYDAPVSGALAAARFIHGQRAGLFDPAEMLGPAAL